MAVYFNNENKRVQVDSLGIGDTFEFDNRIGIVIETMVYDSEWNDTSCVRAWIDIQTGKDFVKNPDDDADDISLLDSTDFVTPVNLFITVKEK